MADDELSALTWMARIRAAGHTVRHTGGEANCDEPWVELTGVRADNGDTMTVTYFWREAERAKLTGKQVWRQHPDDMVWARCVTRLGKRLFADVTLLMGEAVQPPEDYDGAVDTGGRATADQQKRIIAAKLRANEAGRTDDAKQLLADNALTMPASEMTREQADAALSILESLVDPFDLLSAGDVTPPDASPARPTPDDPDPDVSPSSPSGEGAASPQERHDPAPVSAAGPGERTTPAEVSVRPPDPAGVPSSGGADDTHTTRQGPVDTSAPPPTRNQLHYMARDDR